MKMRRRILSLFLCFIMCLPMMPSAAIAAITPYEVWVNGKQFTSDKLTIQCGSGTATYAPSTKTLTLNGAVITSASDSMAAIKASDSLTISVATDSTINISAGIGIEVDGDVTLEGVGDLVVWADSYGITTSGNVIFSGSGITHIISEKTNAVYVADHIQVNGSEKCIRFNTNKFYGKAVTSQNYNDNPVIGTSLAHYSVTPGTLDESYLVYTNNSFDPRIRSFAVTGVKAPKYGESCAVTGLEITSDPADVAILSEGTKWQKRVGEGWKDMSETDTFDAGTYRLSIGVYGKLYEYVFDGWPNTLNVNATLDGETVKVNGSESDSYCYISSKNYVVEDVAHYNVWVGGKEFTEINAETGIACGAGKATLDVTTTPYTLTLDNAEITTTGGSKIHYSVDALKIMLVGTNTMPGDHDLIYAYGHDLIIAGAGSLTATGASYYDGSIYAKNVLFENEGDITISDVPGASYARIECKSLTFAGSGKVTVNGGNYGAINSSGDVVFAGSGEVNLNSTSSEYYYATVRIGSDSKLLINGTNSKITIKTSVSGGTALKGYFGGTNFANYDMDGAFDSAGVVLTLKTPKIPITSVALTGVQAPVYGKSCSVSDIVITTDPVNATSVYTNCFWAKQDDTGFWEFEGKHWRGVTDGETFEVGNYILIAAVYPEDGYEFKLATDELFSVDAKLDGESVIPYAGEAGQCIVNSGVYNVEEPTVYDLWVSGVQVTSVNAGDVLGDGKVKYAADDGTLTILEGANITGVYERALIYAEGMDLIVNAPDGLTMEFNDYYGVRIKGEGDLTVNGNVNLTCFDSNARALFAEKGSIVVNGDLEVHSGAGTDEIGYSAVDAYKDVTVTGNVNISGLLYGLYAHNRNVKVYGNAELQTKWYGLYAYNNIAVDKDVKVTVSGNWVAVTANKGSVTIGGNVTAKYTGTEVNTYYGVHAGTNIEIKGDVNIEGFKEGIEAGDDITIDGSAVIKAVEYGLHAGAYGKITMVSGTWDIAITSTDPYNATVWCSTVVIPDTHTITTPEGGIAQYGTIYDADGTTFAKHVVIAPKGHDETEVKDAKEATCTEDGYTGDTYCKDCGEKLEDGEIIPAKGHTYGEWVVTEEPTTKEAGSRERVCACGDKETEVIPKLTVKIPVTSLDVTVNGYVPGGNPADTEVICSTEGVVVKSFSWKKYSYENWITITDPFETNVDYTIEIFFDVEDGYDVSGLTKDTVTMCGNPLYYYFNNPWSEPSNGAMRIFYNMGEVKYDYAMISGDGSVWTKGSTEGLVFVSEAPFDKFKGYIWIDEYGIDEENLIAESGSTKITIPASILQLDDFAVGEHTVIIVSTDGQASAKFIIQAADSTDDPAGPTDDPAGPSDEPMAPQTGDNTNVLVLLLLAILSLCVFVFVSYKRKEN